MSKLDYCNTLLLGTSGHQLSRLQMIQNMGCRVIRNLKKHDHVSNAMKEIRWLKVQEQIQYKVLVTIDVLCCCKDDSRLILKHSIYYKLETYLHPS